MYINKSIENLLSFWLIIMFVLVSSIIVVGGLTRLTDSGLSITEWELFKGFLPPFQILNGLLILIYIRKSPNINYKTSICH